MPSSLICGAQGSPRGLALWDIGVSQVCLGRSEVPRLSRRSKNRSAQAVERALPCRAVSAKRIGTMVACRRKGRYEAVLLGRSAAVLPAVNCRFDADHSKQQSIPATPGY
jgi:hypothetical protein